MRWQVTERVVALPMNLPHLAIKIAYSKQEQHIHFAEACFSCATCEIEIIPSSNLQEVALGLIIDR